MRAAAVVRHARRRDFDLHSFVAQDSHSAVNAHGWRALVKRLRRANRERLNRWLTRFMGTARPVRAPLAADTRRVLVVRLNKRLGNILFLTPMLRTLAASLPTASIDVLIRDPRQKPLLESLPGIGRVWVQPRGLGALIGLIRRLRRERYDLAIDPTGNSSSNRTAVALSGARQRMGFASNSQWLRLTHAAGRANSRHQAEQAVALLTDSVDELDFKTFDTLAVFPDNRAQTAARAHWVEALGPGPTRGPVIGFFTRATGRKALPAAWWRDWCEQMHHLAPAATLLEIRPPGAEPTADTASVAVAELDVLAALLSRLSVFTAADSGPMHLAAAAGVPVVGLFRATRPEAYAPLGQGCTSVAGETFTGAEAARAAARVLAAEQASGVA
ncbi:glycosyltransferase family 9 protein [Salinisphaera orenii]|uniref:glycosyltransferase family 9 protein n=1 Tax=Salinisphaera orenii TaxID=856731 RepID=UPI000F4AF7FC|nr:glycosyltransferase family 9 protein [Salinisphaera orenii]